MPRKSGKIPAYCLHKASGRAVVRIDHVDHYLGTFGSHASYERYERLISEWRVRLQALTGPNSSRPSPTRVGNLTVEQVLALYWAFAKTYYVKNGEPTGELANMKYALRPVRKLYASLPARDLEPLALKGLQQHLIDTDLCREQINARINRIKRVFRWAVSEQLIPPQVYEGLRTVAGLRFGGTRARETDPVTPVPDAWVDAVLAYVSAEVAAMIRLQRLTGMRPGEVVRLRMSDVDASGTVWFYEPREHKINGGGIGGWFPWTPGAGGDATVYRAATRGIPVLTKCRRGSAKRATETTSYHTHDSFPGAAKSSGNEDSYYGCYSVHSYRRAITRGIRQAVRAGLEILGTSSPDPLVIDYDLLHRSSRFEHCRRGRFAFNPHGDI